MKDILLLSLQVRFTIFANRLINFFSHIPLIKKVFSSRLYGEYGLKTVIAMFGALLIMARKIFGRIFYIGFLMLLGVIVYSASFYGGYREVFAALTSEEIYGIKFVFSEIVSFTLSVWFFLSFTGSFLGAVSIGSGAITAQGLDNDRVMINYLRTDARLYTHARIVVQLISDVALYLLFIITAFYICNIPLYYIASLFILFTAFRLFGEVANMFFFKLTKKHFGIPPYSFTFVFVAFAAAYFPVYFGVINWQELLGNPLTWVLSLAVCFGSWVYINKFNLHSEMIRERIGRIGEIINKAKANSQGGDVFGNRKDAAKWYKHIDVADLASDKHKNKKGFAYLNAIFFDRHSNFFRKKMLIRCAICLAPVALAAAFATYNIVFGDGGSIFQGREIPFHFAPLFFFVLYFASMGRVVTASVFSNCDIHMLHYFYYRTKETTAASFMSRFSVIVLFNLIISVIMAMSVLGAAWLLFGYIDYMLAGVFFALLLMIGFFFSFNDLFLYYVIQPYDSTGQSKSIAYGVINFVIYIFAYINMQIRLDLVDYSIFISVLTVLYLGIGTVLLKTLSPKKFKLR